MTLKLVGLAFEINLMHTKEKNKYNLNEEDLGEFEATKIEPTFMDVIHYSLNYIGILTGKIIIMLIHAFCSLFYFI